MRKILIMIVAVIMIMMTAMITPASAITETETIETVDVVEVAKPGNAVVRTSRSKMLPVALFPVDAPATKTTKTAEEEVKEILPELFTFDGTTLTVVKAVEADHNGTGTIDVEVAIDADPGIYVVVLATMKGTEYETEELGTIGMVVSEPVFCAATAPQEETLTPSVVFDGQTASVTYSFDESKYWTVVLYGQTENICLGSGESKDIDIAVDVDLVDDVYNVVVLVLNGEELEAEELGTIGMVVSEPVFCAATAPQEETLTPSVVFDGQTASVTYSFDESKYWTVMLYGQTENICLGSGESKDIDIAVDVDLVDDVYNVVVLVLNGEELEAEELGEIRR